MSDNEDIQQKMSVLDEKIKKAREKEVPIFNEETQAHETTPEEERSARAGSEFLANVFAGGLIGYGVDWFFGTIPWGLIFFLIMGFVSAVYRANEAMKKNNE